MTTNRFSSCRRTGGEALPFTEGKILVDDFEWSPNGKWIAFLAKTPRPIRKRRKKKTRTTARSIDRDDKRTHLWLADAASGKTQKIGDTPWQFSELQWFPAVTACWSQATHHPGIRPGNKPYHYCHVPTGKMQQLAGPARTIPRPVGLPDGQQVSYVGCRVHGLLLRMIFFAASDRRRSRKPYRKYRSSG